MLLRIFEELAAGNVEQRPHGTVCMRRDCLKQWHSSHTLDARTAQQLQQQRFRLVIGMMRQRNDIAG